MTAFSGWITIDQKLGSVGVISGDNHGIYPCPHKLGYKPYNYRYTSNCVDFLGFAESFSIRWYYFMFMLSPCDCLQNFFTPWVYSNSNIESKLNSLEHAIFYRIPSFYEMGLLGMSLKHWGFLAVGYPEYVGSWDRICLHTFGMFGMGTPKYGLYLGLYKYVNNVD